MRAPAGDIGWLSIAFTVAADGVYGNVDIVNQKTVLEVVAYLAHKRIQHG